MADEGFKRKLTAILSADVIGYSRLMRDDEEATVRDIAAHRGLISDIVQKHHGRIVDSPGDNILAEFASVVDAVNGAIKIQQEISKSNADTPDDRRMEFRIGINLGDVIEEEERIYGDGVNIAARVEGLAAAGGISISGTVYEHIKDKLTLGYSYLGEQDVKNIPEPVRVYRLLTKPEDAGKMIGEEKPKSNKSRLIAFSAFGLIVLAAGIFFVWNNYFRIKIEPASVAKMVYPLPEKASIAVLPFDNLSGEKEQEYFCDGLSEGIINGLAKNDRLFVIARNSTFTYKGKPTKVRQIAEDLGVQYVLEGSVQKADDRVRITAQLVDALSGYHVFSERYDRELQNILNLQDEITMKVLTAIQVKLTLGETVVTSSIGTNNLDAYLKVMQARDLKSGVVNKERVIAAMKLLEQAVALDPNYGYAYSFLATAHFDLVILGASESPGESLRTAIELGEKAVSLDENNPSIRANLVYPYIFVKKFDKAFSEAKKAVTLAPNYAAGYFAQGFALNMTYRHQEAIPVLQKCLRLSPVPVASNVLVLLAGSYESVGQYDEAITTYKKILHIYGQNHLFAHIGLARSYVLMNREKEAHAEAAEVLRIDPDFSIVRFLKSFPMSQDKKDRLAAVLQKAGLPYEPPLPLPDKLSIAVLAFDNLSGDPEQEYFSDGLSEEIISALSKTDQLFVIARNSSFTYKGKPVNVKQISKELGVRYVLEGSVRKSEDRLRITAQLIDATTGHHLWSERYDRDLKDIFALQDEITLKIVTALEIKLTEGEQARMWGRHYKTLDVFLKRMEAHSLWREGTVESHMRHAQVSQEIIDMAPESPRGYHSLGYHYWWLALIGKSPRENIKKAFELAQTAISKDESDPASHELLASVYLSMRRYDKAIASGQRAIELDPNSADVYAKLGQTLSFAERPDEAIEYIKKGMRLNPFPEPFYYIDLGRCYTLKGEYEKALKEYKKALQRAPKAPWPNMYLAIAYSLLDRQEEAHASAKKCLELAPFVSVGWITKISLFKNEADLELIIDAMRKAGFPEGA